ncbi:hypothetical protein FE275_03325 [Pseudomonas koreensis]|nr:hypothetical protein FE275_03325 [Pseudomonas koreensis]
MTALNGVRPAITAAQDSNGQPISNGGSTPDTRIRLTGTANTFLEVEIYDGATSTGKKARADEKGIWTVELTGLTRTKHVFKAKALYGSGTESGEWIVNVVAPVFLVEDFQTYPRPNAENTIIDPGSFMQGTKTKTTVIVNTEGYGSCRSSVFDYSTGLWSYLRRISVLDTFAYSIALHQNDAKSMTINCHLAARQLKIKLEFIQKNSVVSSMTFYEGSTDHDHQIFERTVAPDNGQAFDTIQFVLTATGELNQLNYFRLNTIAFKN